MSFNPEHIHRLMTEKLAGFISKENEAYLDQLIAENEQVRHAWNELQTLYKPEDIESKFIRFDEKQWKPVSASPRKVVPVVRIQRYALVAAILGICLAGLIWFFYKGRPGESPVALQQKPGVQLQLANGQVINLPSGADTVALAGAMLHTAGKTLSYTADRTSAAGWNSLTVPVGMDYKINLDDGSRIWLNAATKLQFPFRFEANRREITVQGEAYLEVARDENRPFIVKIVTATGEPGEVQVLGTAFNVNSYDTGHIRVALVSGSVKLKSSRDTVVLSPGHEGTISTAGTIDITPFDREEVLGWRNGIYYFNGASLQQITAVLPRWFGIAVAMDNPGIGKERFTGLVNRNKPISVFLENLKNTTAIEYYFTADSVLHFK